MAKKMREMLNENLLIALSRYGNDIALSFSGGTDSTCLLFSLLELGYIPHLYTYTVSGVESPDLERARLMSRYYKLPLTICSIPISLGEIIADVRRMLLDGIRGKVGIQCMHGHYYVAPSVTQPVIVNGSGVDGLYGAYVPQKIIGNRGDTLELNIERQKHLADPNDDAMEYQSVEYGKYGSMVVYPYRQQNIIDFLMGLSWDQINKPRMKWITVKDYQREYGKFKGYFRSRGSQQIMAGTRKLHERLLRSPVNKKGRKGVAWVYKDMAKEMGLEY